MNDPEVLKEMGAFAGVPAIQVCCTAGSVAGVVMCRCQGAGGKGRSEPLDRWVFHVPSLFRRASSFFAFCLLLPSRCLFCCKPDTDTCGVDQTTCGSSSRISSRSVAWLQGMSIAPCNSQRTLTTWNETSSAQQCCCWRRLSFRKGCLFAFCLEPTLFVYVERRFHLPDVGWRKGCNEQSGCCSSVLHVYVTAALYHVFCCCFGAQTRTDTPSPSLKRQPMHV